MTRVVEEISEWTELRRSLCDRRHSLGFVPTMGNLHPGHCSLIDRSVAENDRTVLSIFVNPTQFDDARDLEHYPRTFGEDLALAEKLGVDYVLFPRFESIYPEGYRYRVSEAPLSARFCGRHRQGHFDGVLTVVLKLLLLVSPDRAYFGEKDYQQYLLVRDMVRDFFLQVAIIPCPTVRDSDGLAWSSRNLHLSEEERKLAWRFPEILQGEGSSEEVAARLRAEGFEVDYVEELEGRRLAAVRVGPTRLIDNFPLVRVK